MSVSGLVLCSHWFTSRSRIRKGRTQKALLLDLFRLISGSFVHNPIYGEENCYSLRTDDESSCSALYRRKQLVLYW